MTVSPEEVRHLAALARLRLSEDEVGRTAAELESILTHVEVLRRAGAWGSEAIQDEAPRPAPLRADRVDPDPLHAPLDGFAPAWEQDLFVVPRLAALDPRPDGEPDR